MRDTVSSLGERAETYLTETLHQFEPLAWTDKRQSETLRKTFIELGLYEYTRRLAGDETETIRAHLTERVNDRRYAELFDRYPTLFRSYGLPAVTLRLAGDLDPRTERAVGRVLRGDAVWGVERPPNSLLDLLFEAELWGYRDHGYDVETVVSHSAAGHPPDPVRATFDDYYALTHAVFIPTNMGWGHERLLDPPLPYELETTITAGLLRGVAAGHSDVVVELLLTGAIQEQLDPTVFEHVVQWLVSDRSTPQKILPPDIDPGHTGGGLAVPMESREEPAWDGAQDEWLRHYHVNVVTGCTCQYLLDQFELESYDLSGVTTESETFEALATLGEILETLHDYKLTTAAELICELDGRWFREFDGVGQRILAFYRTQEHGDRFGHWPDEQRMFELEHGDAETFERELVEPAAATCREAVACLERALEPAGGSGTTS